jgi:hypothetical protein
MEEKILAVVIGKDKFARVVKGIIKRDLINPALYNIEFERPITFRKNSSVEISIYFNEKERSQNDK